MSGTEIPDLTHFHGDSVYVYEQLIEGAWRSQVSFDDPRETLAEYPDLKDEIRNFRVLSLDDAEQEALEENK